MASKQERPLQSMPSTPSSYKQAITSSDAEFWIKAMQEEYNALLANGTFILVPLPKGSNAVGARWLYKIKQRADGTVERYKARWVAKGYSQQFGIDYDETFAPVVRLENLRFLLALATMYDLQIDQIDVDSAFFTCRPEGKSLCGAARGIQIFQISQSCLFSQKESLWTQASSSHVE